LYSAINRDVALRPGSNIKTKTFEFTLTTVTRSSAIAVKADRTACRSTIG